MEGKLIFHNQPKIKIKKSIERKIQELNKFKSKIQCTRKVLKINQKIKKLTAMMMMSETIKLMRINQLTIYQHSNIKKKKEHNSKKELMAIIMEVNEKDNKVISKSI